MKIGTFGIMNNPEYRQEPWRENISNRLAFFDVVCLVCGNESDIELLAKTFPVEWKNGKLKAFYKYWPFPEWSYEELPKHLNAALELVKAQGCDWAVKLDIDTVFHEKDKALFYTLMQKADERGKWVVSFGKYQFFKPTRYWIKGSLPVALKMSAPLAYGFDNTRYTDLCQPIVWDRCSKVVYNGREYDIPSGPAVLSDKIYKVKELNVFNYDYTFRTYDRSVELLYQIEMAHARFWGKGYSGLKIDNITRQTSINDFMRLSRDRYAHMNKKMRINDHPRFFQDILSNLKIGQWGFDLWYKPSFGLIMTYGLSVSGWERIGSLQREIKPYVELAKHFKPVYIFSYGYDESKKYAKLFSDNVTVISKPKYVPVFVYSLLMPVIHFRVFRGIDIVKTNQMFGSWTAVIVKFIYKSKLVVRCGYEWLQYLERIKSSQLKLKLAKLIERLAYNCADRIIITSDEGRCFIRNRFLVKEDKIVLNPNYVDIDNFKALEINKEFGRIVFVGRLDPVKNLENLILSLVGLDVTLSVIGEGFMKEKLMSLAERNKVRVNFMGIIAQDKLPEELNKSELFVLPSISEGNPKVLLEAMACGLPCLGSNITSIREIIKDGENGVLTETDPKSIHNALLKLLNNMNLRKEVSEKARQTILDKFSFEKIIKNEIKLYEEILR